jgi:UDP-2,3-diacylglucosamine pyrophosphatase LpxH
VSGIVFLADAHLRGRSDPAQHALVEFLRALPARPGGVAVLGDLFEYFAGRNRRATFEYEPVLRQLERFAPFHYLEGNHDFDLCPRWLGLPPEFVHPGPACLALAGVRVLLRHGDRADPRDLGTRCLRGALQSAPLRWLRDRVLPDGSVFEFAMRFASFSRRNAWPGRGREAAELQAWMRRRMAAGGARIGIFAHTHQGLLRRVEEGLLANPGRAVPGGSYLELDGDRLCLRAFPGGEALHPGPLPLRPEP